MTIRNKDGSIYKVRGPNKLMLSQNFWDDDPAITINFDKLACLTINKDLGRIEKSPVVTHKPEPVIEPVIVEEPKVEFKPTPVIETVKPKEDLSKSKSNFRQGDKIEMFCLPVETVTIVDELYNEEIVRTKYKEPFKFQCVIFDLDDLRISFWTNVPHLSEMAIIFQPQLRRWWKVVEIQNDKSGDGWMFSCVPSQIKPDFTF